ncbi:MAG: hypothetical protein ACTSX6_00300 [Candidatus Heimdallarchaeaceae archaeon]
MSFIRINPEDYLKEKIKLQSPPSDNPVKIVSPPSINLQEQPSSTQLLLLKDDEKTLLYLGIIVLGIIVSLAIVAIIMSKRD